MDIPWPLQPGPEDAALAARYLCLIGIVLLLSDHAGSFRQEYTLIWPAKPSFSKYGFLINRYLVTASLLVLFVPLSGFLGLDFNNISCGLIISVVAVVLACCIALDCCLATIRVAALWDGSKSTTITRALAVFFLLSYVSHIATLVLAFLPMRDNIIWSPFFSHDYPDTVGLNMCILTFVSAWMIIASALPLSFELPMFFVVALKYWKLHRNLEALGPSLKHTVARQGTVFFGITSALRILHLGVVSTLNPSIMISMVLISFTSILSVFSNHRMLATRSARLAFNVSRAQRTADVTPGFTRQRITATHPREAQKPADAAVKDMDITLCEGGDAIELRRVDFGMERTLARAADELA